MRKTYYTAPNSNVIARNLSKLMLRKGWRQSDLARAAGQHLQKDQKFGRHLISAYMTGKNMPSQANLEAMAKALGCEVTDIIPAGVAEYVGSPPPAFQMSVTPEGRAKVSLDMEMSSTKAARLMALINEPD